MAVFKSPLGALAPLGPMIFQKELVIGMGAADIEHSVAKRGRDVVDVLKQCFNRSCFKFRDAANEAIDRVGIPLVDALVMALQRLDADNRLQRIKGKAKVGARRKARDGSPYA